MRFMRFTLQNQRKEFVAFIHSPPSIPYSSSFLLHQMNVFFLVSGFIKKFYVVASKIFIIIIIVIKVSVVCMKKRKGIEWEGLVWTRLMGRGVCLRGEGREALLFTNWNIHRRKSGRSHEICSPSWKKTFCVARETTVKRKKKVKDYLLRNKDRGWGKGTYGSRVKTVGAWIFRNCKPFFFFSSPFALLFIFYTAFFFFFCSNTPFFAYL